MAAKELVRKCRQGIFTNRLTELNQTLTMVLIMKLIDLCIKVVSLLYIRRLSMANEGKNKRRRYIKYVFSFDNSKNNDSICLESSR